jgi:MFS family permease
VVGYSATAAGAALLPFPLIVGGLSPVFGDLAGRIGARPLLITGGLLVAGGLLLGLRASGGAYAADVLPAVAVAAAGMGCAAAPLTSAVLSSVGPDHTGAASGLNSAVAQLGGVIAVALIGGVLAAKGGAFVDAFRIAIVASAGACVAAAAAIAVLFRPTSTGRAM